MVENDYVRNKLGLLFGILISIMLLSFNALAIEDNDIDHLKKELQKTSGKQKLKVLHDIVNFYYQISAEETDIYLPQYLALAEKEHSIIDVARANYFYSSISLLHIEYHKSISYARKALKLYEAIGDSINILKQYTRLSRAYILLREPDSAMVSINISLKYFKKYQHISDLQSVRIQLSKAYFISDRYIESRNLLQEVVKESRSQKQYGHLAWASYWLGASNVRLGNFSEAISNFSDQIDAYNIVKNISGKLGGMQELGDIYLKIGEFANAYQLYFDCYQQKDVLKGYRGELQFTAEYHTNLGKIYHNTQRYQEALEQFDTAIRQIDHLDFSVSRGVIYNEIGQTYLSMNKPRMALNHFEKSYTFYQKIKNNYNTALSQNHIAEVYMNLKQYDSAVSYLINARETNANIGNKYGESLNYKNLAACYYHQDKYEKAMDQLDAGMPYVLQSGIDDLKLEYYSMYITLCNKVSDYHRAKLFFEKFLPLSRKVTSQHTKNLSDLLLRIYTNDLNIRTEFLNQTIELQNLEADQNAFQLQRLWLFTLVIILILIIIGILYYFNLKTAKKLHRLVDERTLTIRENEQKLIEMAKAKDKMYSIIAHDLKSPFNTLLGFSALLHDEYDELSEEDKMKYIHVMHNSSEKFYVLLENLLEWTRSSSNGIKYMPVKNDLNLIIQHIIQLQERNAREKQITIINNVPINTFVFADENMLRTIIRNLTSNAIKFTDIGGSVSFDVSSSKEDMVKCIVKDTGTGIAPEDIKNLFNTDSKIRKKGTANEGGTGLGLLLIKEFIEKNKGNLTVESQVGVGSTFSFELPVK